MKPVNHNCRLPVLTLLFVTLPLSVHGDDWPHWFGPRGDGAWHESGIVRELTDEGPKILWRADVHAGYSGPAVVGDRVYLLDRIEEKNDKATDPQRISTLQGTERVLCLNAETGQTNWIHEYGCQYTISYPSGPRTTPTIDEGRVYSLGAMGDLLCLDALTGDVIWSKNFIDEYGLERAPVWGWASHPLIDGDKLICVVGGEGSGVVAFNKQTGEEIWRAITAKEMGYATPVIVERNGKRALIVWHDVAIQCLDIESGKRLWRIKFPENDPMRPSVAIAQPCVFGDHLLVSDFYHGSIVVRLADDLTDAEVVWQSEGAIGEQEETLNVLMAAPIARRGNVYGFSGAGELRCLEGKTGKIKWRDLAPTGDEPTNFASTFIIPNGDRDFLFNDQGELIVARLTSEGYEEFGRAKLLEPTGFARGRNVVWSHPAFANRRMYARNDRELICVDLSAEEAN
jgi:outer membrane protein assembly factor BamB